MRPCSVSRGGVEGAGGPDPLLLSILRATDEAAAQRHLDVLLCEHAEPIIDGILRRRRLPACPLAPDEGEALDTRGDILLHLLVRLRRCRADPHGPDAIRDFAAYVAVTTYRACDEDLRRKHPRRESLKSRIRYLLTHRPDLALWRSEGEDAWLCGLASAPTRRDGERHPLAEQITGLLHRAGRPLELEALVNVVAEQQGIHDAPPHSLGGGEEDWDESRYHLPPSPSIPEVVVQRDYLGRLWSEIRGLPPRQRAALPLNFRDDRGRGVLALLPLSGVAGIRELAAALDLGAEEFAALWNELPLDDAAIGGRLRCTRQQVINLRKVARERLARKMKHEN